MIFIKDNFFDYFDQFESFFKTVPLYTKEELTNNFNYKDQYWPGRRSKLLHTEVATQPIYFLFLKEFNQKIGHVISGLKWKVNLSVHLRVGETTDWIHKDDDVDYAMVINLSETNLNSGTCFYDEEKKETIVSKFVKNRAVFYDAQINHSSVGNYGKDIESGRLTLNAFFWVVNK